MSNIFLILILIIILFVNIIKTKEHYENIKYNSYINSCRFDLMAKYLYIKSKDKNIKTDFFKDLYINHIISFNNCNELPDKHNVDDKINEKNKCINFIYTFDKIIESIKTKGFSNKYPIPVGKNNVIINGSHRLMISYYLNITPVFKFINDRGFEGYNYDYFINKTKNKKLDTIYSDTMALEYIKHNKNIRTMIIYPNAYYSKNLKKIYSIIKNYGYLYYEKDIELNLNGLNNLVNECYRGEKWIGGLFPSKNINNKTKNVKYNKNKNNKIKILLIDMNIAEKCLEMKNNCRNLFNMGKDSLHTTDFEEDTFRISASLLNKNSVNYLNYGVNDISMKSKELLKKYFNELKNNEDYCVTSSFIMELYNLRKANDLDYLNFNDININIKDINVHNNKWQKYYHVNKDEIIYNPKYHFYFNGFKFAILDVVKKMKENRNENKDIEDIKLIKKFI